MLHFKRHERIQKTRAHRQFAKDPSKRQTIKHCKYNYLATQAKKKK